MLIKLLCMFECIDDYGSSSRWSGSSSIEESVNDSGFCCLRLMIRKCFFIWVVLVIVL